MIRYNKELVNDINKTVRNYNAKIRRLQKQNPSLSLPEKINAKKLRNMSDNRKELYKNMQKLKRFSVRGSENNIILSTGEIVSEYELSELKRESARLQRNLTKRINKLAETKPKVKGIKQDYTYAEMGDMHLNNLIVKRDTLKEKTKNIRKEGSFHNLSNLVKTVRERQEYQISIFRNKYVDEILGYQVYAIGYDREKYEMIKAELNKLDDKDFLKFFDTEKSVQAIRDKYRDSTKLTGDNYFDYEEELTDILDNLSKNIKKYLKDYKSYNA